MRNGADNYKRFLDGDDQGIVEIIKEYKDALILFLNGYLHDIYAAEDLAEDVFLHLVIKKPKYIPNYSFKTWLFTIGRNRARNTLRFHKRVIAIETADLEKIEKDTLNLEKNYIKKEDKILLHKAMDKLPLQYSEVLYLAYFELLSVHEISKITRKSEKQISNLLYRAKGALKNLLNKEGYEYEEL